jgi:hypothetical protein
MIRRARVPTLVPLIALAVCIAGCESQPSNATASSPSAADSSGVRIISYSVTDLDSSPSQPVGDTTPVLRIGAIDGPPGTTLNGVRAVAESPSGVLAFADDQGTVIRFYGSDGTYLGAQGAEGDGPGEYRSIIGLSYSSGDSLVVYDLGNARLSIVAPDHQYARSLPLPLPPNRLAGRNRVYGIGPLGGVMLFQARLDPRRLRDPARNMQVRLEQDTLALLMLRMTETEVTADTLARVPGMSLLVMPRPNGESRRSIRFGSTAFLSSNQSAFVVAHGSAFEIKRYDQDGQLDQIIRVAASPRPVTNGDRGASGPQDEETAFAESHPLIDNVVLDGNGNVWVDPDDSIAAGRGWIVFSPDGEVRGWVPHLGPHGFPLHVGREFVHPTRSTPTTSRSTG